MRRSSSKAGHNASKSYLPRYHELKALAHLAFGVQLTLLANGSGQLTELTASEFHEKRLLAGAASTKCGNSSPRSAAAPVAHIGAQDDTVSASRMAQVRSRWRGHHRQVGAATAPQI